MCWSYLGLYASKTIWGVHLQDLTTSGIWIREELSLHINIFGMKAVQLALNTFTGRIMGESMVLMSNGVTVVGYTTGRLCFLWYAIWHKRFSLRGAVCSLSHYMEHPREGRSPPPARPTGPFFWPSGPFFLKCLASFARNRCILTLISFPWANLKLPWYVFSIPDFIACKEDTFQHSWGDLSIYASPSFALLRFFQKCWSLRTFLWSL